jgi:hypothetical protein
LFVKNAPSLLVKVYEINTRHYYRTHAKEVDTDVNLDGLVANYERVIPGGPDPFRRAPVTLEFPDPKAPASGPEANRPGVYVIDLIANGKSSRALIRKGRLYPLVTTGTAGQVIRVVDEARRPVSDASVWLGGKEYAPDKDGAVIVPFSTAPGRRPIVLCRGDFGCLDFLQHQPEQFHLTAGIHVDRESLLTQRIAPVLIRPSLTLNGKPVSSSCSKMFACESRPPTTTRSRPRSRCRTSNCSRTGSRSTRFGCPRGWHALSVTLTAKVKVLSTGSDGGPDGIATRSGSARSPRPTRSKTCTWPGSGRLRDRSPRADGRNGPIGP